VRRGHSLATLDGRDARADIDDDARAITHRDAFGGFTRSVATREDVEIAMVEGCGTHLHDHFACAGHRRRPLAERERGEALLRADLVGAHRRCAACGARRARRCGAARCTVAAEGDRAAQRRGCRGDERQPTLVINVFHVRS